jgi:hypothetical protein
VDHSDIEPNSNDYTQSSLRESLIEHLFVGGILKKLWLSKRTAVEVLKPQVDSAGYDLAIDCNSSPDKDHSSIRYIQLKSSRSDAKTARVNVSLKLTKKPNWCVIWITFEQTKTTFELKQFRIFPKLTDPHPEMGKFSSARHTRGDKAVRPGHCVVPLGEFDPLDRIDEVVERLFPKTP